jgi:2-methylcitrate dehydratase PrpD
MTDVPGLSLRIAEHIVRTGYGDLPAATTAATKASLLDAIGVMLAATTLGEGTAAFADLARAAGGPAEAALIGRAARVPAAAAALANGALAHAIDFEDGHDGAPVHPNAVQIPAALALAQASGLGNDPEGGRALLTALALGCDLTCRLGLALRADPAARGWYPPPILGGFGAVAACAKLAGLEPRQIVDAWSLLLCSATCSGEIKYSPQSHMRAVRDAFPAQAALQAVQLAARGVAGFAAPLEGKAGFFALYAGGEWDDDALLGGLGERFEGERLTFKAWPSCRGTHAFIEGALALRDEIGDVAAIERVSLAGHPVMRMLDEPHAGKRAPATAIDAKFSAPFTAAVALIDGAVTLDSFAPQSRARADVAALANRVAFAPIADAAPGAIASGGIAVELRDGRRLERFVAEPLGHPSHPLGPEALAAKFRQCAAFAQVPPTAAAAEAMVAAIADLDAPGRLGRLFALLDGAVA